MRVKNKSGVKKTHKTKYKTIKLINTLKLRSNVYRIKT